jgi:tripartite-type tricarboxylate transporter receptor subunit TctC
MIPTTRRSALAMMLGAVIVPATSRTSGAQTYPERIITILVPWAPGGSTDILARVVAEHLRRSLKQTVVVENRPGASGNIGSAVVARAAPDGYTLLFGSMSTHAMNNALYAKMPFNGVDSFTPISLLAYVTNTMVIHPSVPANTVQEFIDYAKANPGDVPYASAGAGSTNHLSAVLFERMTGIQMLHVPYKGGAPAVVDTLAGQTKVLFSAGTQTLKHVEAGKLKLLAVTESRRSELLPNVPTVAETVPGYELAVWYGAFGPAGLPKDMVTKLNTEINGVLLLPDVKKRMADTGVEVVNATAEEFAIKLRSDADKWGKLIRELGIVGE